MERIFKFLKVSRKDAQGPISPLRVRIKGVSALRARFGMVFVVFRFGVKSPHPRIEHFHPLQYCENFISASCGRSMCSAALCAPCLVRLWWKLRPKNIPRIPEAPDAIAPIKKSKAPLGNSYTRGANAIPDKKYSTQKVRKSTI